MYKIDLYSSVKRKKLLKDIAYDKIKNKILRDYEEYTTENTLVEELEMSRTPIRQAIQRLEHEGFVQTFPNKGIFIKELSMNERNELIDLRVALETSSLKKAISRINENDFKNLEEIICKQKESVKSNDLYGFLEGDAEFHQYLLEIEGNTLFISLYQNARERLFTVRDSKSLLNRNDLLESLILEHERLLGFLKEGNNEAARIELTNHLENGKSHY